MTHQRGSTAKAPTDAKGFLLGGPAAYDEDAALLTIGPGAGRGGGAPFRTCSGGAGGEPPRGTDGAPRPSRAARRPARQEPKGLGLRRASPSPLWNQASSCRPRVFK